MPATSLSSATARPPRTDAGLRWPTLRDTTTACFLLVLFASACVMPLQSDFWWHLRAGQEMWSRHFIMLADEFSFTAHGAYWPNHEWLSEVVFFAAYKLGGLPAVTLVAAGCVTGAVALSWRLMHGQSSVKLLMMAAAIPSVVFVWTVRPHMFTLLLSMVVLHLVLRMRYWPLPIVFAVWANLHGGVALGLVVMGAATLAEVWVGDRRGALRLAGVSAACFAATFVTPLGLDLWKTIPVSVQKSMANGIMEWRPPILFGWRDVSFWAIAIGILLAAAMRRRRIVNREDAVLVIVSLAVLPLALRYSRNMTPFVLVAVPALSRLMPSVILRPHSTHAERHRLNAGLLAVLALGCAIGVTGVWTARSPRLHWEPVSQQIVSGIRDCQGRLYNRFDDGGYVIWFAPDVPVFVDNRQDPYPLAFLQEHLQREQSGEYEDVFARYAASCAFLPPQSSTAGRLLAAGWNITASDSNWLVLQEPHTNPSRRR